jgi:hypothetical protein
MRSIKQIEESITETKLRYAEISDLNAIATFPESERLLAMFERKLKFYQDSLNALDENNPVLSKEFAKNKICIKLMSDFIQELTESAQEVELSNKRLLALNEELGKAKDEMALREKNAM